MGGGGRVCSKLFYFIFPTDGNRIIHLRVFLFRIYLYTFTIYIYIYTKFILYITNCIYIYIYLGGWESINHTCTHSHTHMYAKSMHVYFSNIERKILRSLYF